MKRTLLGVLTPSSNTALEPLTSAMVASLPGVSAHFGRFRVTEISLGAGSQGQFEFEPILDAARLLADARVDAIVWSGTSSGWLGFERDERLCAAITAETGVPACTAVLAFNEVMTLTGRRRFGLVTPYLDDVQARIVENYRREGFDCVAERHTGQSVNFEFSEVTEATLTRMAREVATAKPECITTFCTNLNAAHLVPRWEAELGIPVYDTVSTAVWKALRTCGVDARPLAAWGRLFSEDLA
ncbi:MAG: aspartate/glutamate racemase family protein [Burkholderiaceae bacterium]|nr:aspartate/glutamate racemase family protein [Burkholderiales bacterium]MCZ8340644.1 aspartate/glutamate racemase family protein [Burkholderiaceae bacterium]